MPAKLLAICILNLLIYYQVINDLLLHSSCDMWWVNCTHWKHHTTRWYNFPSQLLLQFLLSINML